MKKNAKRLCLVVALVLLAQILVSFNVLSVFEEEEACSHPNGFRYGGATYHDYHGYTHGEICFRIITYVYVCNSECGAITTTNSTVYGICKFG